MIRVSGIATGQMRTEAKSPMRSLIEVLRCLEPIEEDFPEVEDLPAEPVELDDAAPGSDDAFRELMEFLTVHAAGVD
jgi:hypothetical protein